MFDDEYYATFIHIISTALNTLYIYYIYIHTQDITATFE